MMYKVWISIECVDEAGEVLGDEYFEPEEAASTEDLDSAREIVARMTAAVEEVV